MDMEQLLIELLSVYGMWVIVPIVVCVGIIFVVWYMDESRWLKEGEEEMDEELKTDAADEDDDDDNLLNS
jgi:uncharacterized membrane protein